MQQYIGRTHNNSSKLEPEVFSGNAETGVRESMHWRPLREIDEQAGEKS